MTVIFDENRIVELLKRLVETPSPSGYTEKVMKLITSKKFNEIGVSYKKQIKVQSLQRLKGRIQRHRLLTAHTDTLGRW